MLIRDSVMNHPTGHFALDVFRRGKLIERIREPNLIVGGYGLIQSQLLGGNVTGNSITQFGIGTNGTAPVAGNTALTGPYYNAIASVTYPAANQVAFGFGLASGEANGVAIMEFGLLTTAGALYARKVRAAALNKDTDISFAGVWTITYP